MSEVVAKLEVKWKLESQKNVNPVQIEGIEMTEVHSISQGWGVMEGEWCRVSRKTGRHPQSDDNLQALLSGKVNC